MKRSILSLSSNTETRMVSVNFEIHSTFILARISTIMMYIGVDDYTGSMRVLDATINDIAEVGISGIHYVYVDKTRGYLESALVMLVMQSDKQAIIELEKAKSELHMAIKAADSWDGRV
jgi:hypothetical protein